MKPDDIYNVTCDLTGLMYYLQNIRDQGLSLTAEELLREICIALDDVEEAVNELNLLMERPDNDDVENYIHPFYRDSPFALDVLRKFGHDELPGRL